MTNYEKPVILTNEDLAEGVYAASGAAGGGGDCYTVTAYITQTPQIGNERYTIHVDGFHNTTTHHSTGQVLVLSFNMPVTYSSSNGSLSGGDGTAELRISYSYHNNAVDNIGLGDVYVSAGEGLAVTGARLECNYSCDQHSGLPNYPG